MILETLDMIRDWLDGPHGVNAHLSLIPVTAPDVTPPLVGAVLVPHRSSMLAQDKLPTGPKSMLVISLASEAKMDFKSRTMAMEAHVEVMIRYITRSSKLDEAQRQGMIAIRAVNSSLITFLKTPDARTRADVSILGHEGIKLAPVREDWGQETTTAAALVVLLRVRDMMESTLTGVIPQGYTGTATEL